MLTYDEVNDLVRHYQDGGTDRVGTLVDAFSPYLRKWVEVVKGRWINTVDPEVAAFTGMFDCESISTLCSSLARCTYHMTEEDVLHEMIVIFLRLAQKYVQLDSGFTAYLKSSMKYRVYDWVMHEMDGTALSYEKVDGEAPEKAMPDTALLYDPDLLPSDITTKERATLYMRYMDKMTVNEIAALNNCSCSVINSILRTGRRKMEVLLHR